jgi:hypothetical protein
MPASVVDLPEPVGPVTSTSPRGSSASVPTHGGRPSSLQRDGADGDPAEHEPAAPRARNALTRNRPTPGPSTRSRPRSCGRTPRGGRRGAPRTPSPRCRPRSAAAPGGGAACRRSAPGAASPPCSAGPSRTGRTALEERHHRRLTHAQCIGRRAGGLERQPAPRPQGRGAGCTSAAGSSRRRRARLSVAERGSAVGATAVVRGVALAGAATACALAHVTPRSGSACVPAAMLPRPPG